MGDDERRVKRSRFDQTEPEPRRPSRFDRRSRSPSSRQIDSRRSRSPMGKDPRSPTSSDKRSASLDPAAAAGDHHRPHSHSSPLTFSKAAAAAKINAELQARKGIQHADVPPIRSVRDDAHSGRPPLTISADHEPASKSLLSFGWSKHEQPQWRDLYRRW